IINHRSNGRIGKIGCYHIALYRLSSRVGDNWTRTDDICHRRCFVSVESFSGMFRSSSPLLRKSEASFQVQDTIITAWTIRHPTRNHDDPIARAKLYQLSYIPLSQVEH
ncbi:hypothetical protein RND81_04G034700, partial [Saponaria officinalis]